MLIAQESAKVTGNLPFQRQVAMQLDPGAVAMHIRHLIRMYANPRLAALREYTSNARDSHRAAKYTGPVEVTLPTSLHPFLTIRDHGLGLTGEEVEGFGQFGRSTKNGDNEYIGGFGLGSKSGLAVATQFTVIAVKDGLRNTVVVGRDENNMPSLGFVGEGATSDPNGVTIQIPSATDHADWRTIGGGDHPMFIGWEPGSILINGKAPNLSVHDAAQFTRLDGGWLSLAERKGHYYGSGTVHALVAGVHYEIQGDKIGDYGTIKVLRGSVLEVENGSVDILGSRDDLEWTDRTSRAIKAAAQRLYKSTIAEYQRRVHAAPSFREAKVIQAQMDDAGIPTSNMFWGTLALSWYGARNSPVLTRGDAKPTASAKIGYSTDKFAIEIGRENDSWKFHSVLVTGATGTAATGYARKNQKHYDQAGESTAYITAEVRAGSADAEKNVRVYFHNGTDTTGLNASFVASMAKVITVADFMAQAKAERAVWATMRTQNVGPAKVKVADRQVRILSQYLSEGQTQTSESYVSRLTAANWPIVVVSAEDSLGSQFLDFHARDYSSQALRSLAKIMANRVNDTTFIMLSRNQKVDALGLATFEHLSVWANRVVAEGIVVRTPMQRAVNERLARRSYGQEEFPVLPDAAIASILDPLAQEYMRAIAHPVHTTDFDEAAVLIGSAAPVQPAVAAFDIAAAYPCLGLLTQPYRVGDAGQRIADYLNLVHTTR